MNRYESERNLLRAVYIKAVSLLPYEDPGRRYIVDHHQGAFHPDLAIRDLGNLTKDTKTAKLLTSLLVEYKVAHGEHLHALEIIQTGRTERAYRDETYIESLYNKAMNPNEAVQLSQASSIAYTMRAVFSRNEEKRQKWDKKRKEAIVAQGELLVFKCENSKDQELKSSYENWTKTIHLVMDSEGFYGNPENQHPTATKVAKKVVDLHLNDKYYQGALDVARQSNLPTEEWDRVFAATESSKLPFQQTLWKVNKWLYKHIGWGGLITSKTQLVLVD